MSSFLGRHPAPSCQLCFYSYLALFYALSSLGVQSPRFLERHLFASASVLLRQFKCQDKFAYQDD